MSRARRSFPPALLDSLRAMTVQETLDRLGLYWKRDPDFVPVKDKAAWEEASKKGVFVKVCGCRMVSKAQHEVDRS